MKIRKGNSPKVNQTQEFLNLGPCLTPGAIKGAICSLLSGFYSKKFPPFPSASHNNPILITPERGQKEGAGMKMGKGSSPKVNQTQGFLTLGQSNWTICSLLN